MQKWEYCRAKVRETRQGAWVRLQSHSLVDAWWMRDDPRRSPDIMPTPPTFAEFLALMGEQGWELVSASTVSESNDQEILYFKRPVVEK